MKIWNFLKNNTYAKNISLAILITVIIFLGLKWWLNVYTRHGQAVIVPDVKGLSVQEASAFFNNSNLRFEVVDSVYNKNSKQGAIVETIPTAGTKVKENRNIFITINAFSSRTSIIPDVKNLSLRQAIAKLNAVDFKDIQVKHVPAAWKDLVLGLEYKGREINAGERLSLDSKLVLLVSEVQNTDGYNGDSSIESNTDVSVDESWLYN